MPKLELVCAHTSPWPIWQQELHHIHETSWALKSNYTHKRDHRGTKKMPGHWMLEVVWAGSSWSLRVLPAQRSNIIWSLEHNSSKADLLQYMLLEWSLLCIICSLQTWGVPNNKDINTILYLRMFGVHIQVSEALKPNLAPHLGHPPASIEKTRKFSWFTLSQRGRGI